MTENDDSVLRELKALHEKVDAIAANLALLVNQKRQRAEKRKADSQLLQLTPEDVQRYQNRFKDLFTRWLQNQESAVREELEAMTVEELRRLADANNLNVTAKSGKEKVIRLIGFRFREKKQLTHSIARPPTATP